MHVSPVQATTKHPGTTDDTEAIRAACRARLPPAHIVQRKDVLQFVDAGRNIFISGHAGYGKTTYFKCVIWPRLKAKFPKGTVWITATTGVAANNIGGMTYQAMAGVGRMQGTIEHIVQNMPDKAKRRVECASALVIEESSMMSAEDLETLDAVFRAVRGVDKPMGGCCFYPMGDNAQLGPVCKFEKMTQVDRAEMSSKQGTVSHKQRESQYAFESPLWNEFNFVHLKMLYPWRYGGDMEFWETMEWVREGRSSPELTRRLGALRRPLRMPAEDVVQLVCRKKTARVINRHTLSTLPGDEWRFGAVDWNGDPCVQHRVSCGRVWTVEMEAAAEEREQQAKRAGRAAHDDEEVLWVAGADGQVRRVANMVAAPHVLYLKVGAWVMATQSLNHDVPNGTLGTVTGFRKFRAADVHLMNEWEMGRHILRDHLLQYTHQMNPVGWVVEVAFQGKQGKQVMMDLYARMHTIEDLDDDVICARLQYPIVLRYALTIHKAQCATLLAAELHLHDVFAPGQPYSGMTRVMNKDCLRLTGRFADTDIKKKWVSETVLDWDKGVDWLYVDNREELQVHEVQVHAAT